MAFPRLTLQHFPALCSSLLVVSMTSLTPAFLPSVTLAKRVSTPSTHLSRQPSSFCPSSRFLTMTPRTPSLLPPVPAMTATTPANATSAKDDSALVGPSWILEYTSLHDPVLIADLAAADVHLATLNTATAPLATLLPIARDLTPDHPETPALLPALLQATRSVRAASVLLENVVVQASCVGSVDGTDPVARKVEADMQTRFSSLQQAYEPASLLLDLIPDSTLQLFLSSHPDARDGEYRLHHSRQLRESRLSLAEENLQTALGVPGHSAWGSLYTDLSSTLTARVLRDGEIEPRVMGLASAEALRDSADAEERRASWYAVREAWRPHRETTAATLNAITAWRLDDYARRKYPSATASSLHQNRMSQGSLSALVNAIDSSAHVGRRALQVQARALGKKKLDPWDIFAPAPVATGVGKLYTFDEGVELIADAVGEVDTEAGKFVRMMRDKKWIEASRGDAKRPGAYCTGFAKSRTPRVYLSDYNGRAGLLLTLAHELGHAFHSWQMRDLPQPQLDYPMNLAETASIFFETVVGNKLLEKAISDEERLSILWGEAENAAQFLLNIPARFRFEEGLCEARKNGKLSADEIDELMVQSWQRYYGDALDKTELMGVFAQSKLHFYLTGISFYNWPYSFGYLFALGVYAEYERGADGFAGMYRDLLRDTGRMDAEDVVEKHLGGRIDDEAFWKRAIGVAERKVELFEEVAGKVNAKWKA